MHSSVQAYIKNMHTEWHLHSVYLILSITEENPQHYNWVSGSLDICENDPTQEIMQNGVKLISVDHSNSNGRVMLKIQYQVQISYNQRSRSAAYWVFYTLKNMNHVWHLNVIHKKYAKQICRTWTK